MVRHYHLTLPAYSSGFHLITEAVCSAVHHWPENGLLNVFIQHTSAALCINENADPTVLTDFKRFFNHLVPENLAFFEHTEEGPDDMPAHIKSAFLHTSISIPIVNGKAALGVWQGIYLCEFRAHARPRSLIISVTE